jgi:prepilin-type N-terminal cleavage/methylation domain-containing protein
MNNRSLQGFTLSELLVSLAVLGLIAAFAIPKVLTAVGESSSRAIGREAFGMISEAYQAVRASNNGNTPRSTNAQTLRDTLNYARVGTGGNGGGTNASIVLQNGAQIAFVLNDGFADNLANQVGVIGFTIDPDGPLATSANGPVSVFLGGDGRIWAGNELYQAGTGTTLSPFNTIYGVGTANTPVTSLPPNNTGNANSSTTWFS